MRLAGSEKACRPGLEVEQLIKVWLSVTAPVRLSGLRESDGEGFASELLSALRLPMAFKSLIAIPIVQLRGATLVVAHREPAVFSERDESVLAGLSTQAAIALENARLYGEAEGLIRRSPRAIASSISSPTWRVTI